MSDLVALWSVEQPRDTNGPITLDDIGAPTITTTPGFSGDPVWLFANASGVAKRMSELATPMSTVEGCLGVRFKRGSAIYQQLIGIGAYNDLGNATVAICVTGGGNVDHYCGSFSNQYSVETVSVDAVHTLIMQWDGGQVSSWLDGAPLTFTGTGDNDAPYVLNAFAEPDPSLVIGGYGGGCYVEQAIFYRSFLTEQQISDLASSSWWSWPVVNTARWMDTRIMRLGVDQRLGPQLLGDER